MTIKIFEESNRLYVEVENPPAGLKDKLAALATDAIVNSLEGLVPQEEKKPEIPKREVLKAEDVSTDDGWQDLTTADGWQDASTLADENPFVKDEVEEEDSKPAKKAASKPAKTIEELAADDDWA